MDLNYLILCGVMWLRYGNDDAARELLRALKSVNPDLSAVARAILSQGASGLPTRQPSN